MNANTKHQHGVLVNAANCVAKIYNCVGCNGKIETSGYLASFWINNCHNSSVIENCTAYNTITNSTGKGCGLLNTNNIDFTAKNIASFANTYDYAYGATPTAGLGSTNASKCASSDTTGSEAALRSLTAATEFVSLDIASADFLKVATGATQLKNGGVAPSIAANTTGIRGNVRPH